MLHTNQYIKQQTNSLCKMLSQKEIQKIQSIVLDMMEDLDAIFQEYGIEYYLGGGSALGAIRHQGFIPWDEDLDLNMFRSSYEKLIQVFDTEPRLYEKYYLCENSYDHEFDVNFMKIKLKGTVYQEYLYSDYSKDGVFIDIFPVENVPNSKLLRKFHGSLVHSLLFVCSCLRFYSKKKKYLTFSDEDEYVKIVKKKARIGWIFSFLGINFFLWLSKKIMSFCKNQDSIYLTVPTGRKHYFDEMILRSDVLPLKRVSFDRLSLPVANHNDIYMTHLFGNYMKIPKKENREKHFIYKLDFSFLENKK